MNEKQAYTKGCLFIILIIVAIVVGIYAESFVAFLAMIIIGTYAINKFSDNNDDYIPRMDDDTPTFSDDLINDATDYSRALTLRETEYFCSIAGVSHHNDEDNIGGFIGYCMADPTNRLDKNAIGIYESGGRLVGYIPKDEQKNFRAWSKRNPLPCIGFIEVFDDRLRGKVKVIDACPELTELHMFKFIRWLILNHGKGFIPSSIEIHKNVVLITEDQWLDFIEECIAESEEAVKALRRQASARRQTVIDINIQQNISKNQE